MYGESMLEQQSEETKSASPYSTQSNDWWATTDFPGRSALRAAFLIDGRMTMLEMCVRFIMAKKSIHIAAWGLTPDLLMVRGKHQRAGEPESPEQEELEQWLRGKGLAPDEIAFWSSEQELSVCNVLRYAVERGVNVRVLLWDAYTLPFHSGPRQIKEQLEAVGVICLLDNSNQDLQHPIESLHQKTVTIDGQYAFVGGIDLMARSDGEFDRWDTKGHPYYNLLRRNKHGRMPHSWHDVHVLFEGPTVTDVEQNFCQRWNDVVERQKLADSHAIAAQDVEMTLPHNIDAIPMQVTRTIPTKTYTFALEQGIATTLESYFKAFTQAKKTIYIENQYFWRRTFLGIENPILGIPHADMEQLFQALVDALLRGVHVTLVLPDNPNVGRNFTDDGLKYLWEISPQAVTAGILQVYTLGSSWQQEERVLYRPIYVHAKVAIVDDEWISIGSANLNNRGMRDDAELNVSLLHPHMAHGLRVLLMAEHLGLCDEDTLFAIVEAMGRSNPGNELAQLRGDLGHEWTRLRSLLSDPYAGMAACLLQARENLEAVKSGRLLKGHLLPYIRHDLAKEYEVEVSPVNGWLSQLSLPDDVTALSQDEVDSNSNEQSIETE